MSRLVPVAVALTLVAACSRSPSAPTVDERSFRADIQALSSDAFEGRAPASLGEQRTVRYLIDRFSALGLRPGNGLSWTQDVPLVGITSTASPLTIVGAGASFSFENGKDAVIFSKRVAERVALERSGLVFVGYGVTAPEVGWDDYKGLDVRGKTLVMLVNDPDFAADAPGDFGGKRMTYYGRWTYKYEEAARRGAAGVLLVHDLAGAGYGWNVVTGSWTGEQFDLKTADGNAGRAAVEGWLTHDAAAQVLAAAGQDLAALEVAARSKDFQPVPLPLEASATLESVVRETPSRNVVALLPGAERPDEYVVYAAHWDHLGMDPARDGDRIFNGAVDNATGTAALVELARLFGSAPTRPARSVVFIAVTAEESGLLGSRWYAENPVFPLSRTVAAINVDAMAVSGRSRDVVVVGRGASELEDLLETAVRSQGRYLTDEDSPEKGSFYRSDHFSFAKRGVPALYAESGVDLVEGGVEAGRAANSRHLKADYHQPSDEYHADWDLGGAIEDLMLYFTVGSELAAGTAWPNWRAGNEFRATRDAQRAAAAAEQDALGAAP